MAPSRRSGGEECLLTPLPIDSIAYAYMTMTGALGSTPLRHEGKLTGLAAYGQPILADKIAARFSVETNPAGFSRIFAITRKWRNSSMRL
jgi:predicted NodU family carbamoyl transferase